MIVTLALVISLLFSFSVAISPSFAAPTPDSPTSTQSNAAYLNGTESYYTNAGVTSSGSMTLYSQPDYFLNSTYIFAGSVGTTQSVNSGDNIYLGTYQYYGYFGVGNGLSSSSYAETPNMAIAFEAGVGTVSSNYEYNVGTIYATLTMINVTSGNQVQTSWQYTMNAEWPYPGDSGVIFSPEWFPNAPGGTYQFYLYIGVTPYLNYNSLSPNLAETTSNSGFSIDEFAVSYPSTPSFVYFEDGWAYTGLTLSGLQIYGYSFSFTPSFPGVTAAMQLYFSSPFPVEMYAITSDGTFNTIQEKSGSLTFKAYLPEGGWFGNVIDDPGVPQFSINWYAENVIIPGIGSVSLVATGEINESGNWFNATGGNSYQFQFTPYSGALNGQTVDGVQWDTTLSYTTSHLLDPGYGAPVNVFTVDGNGVANPQPYNAVSESLSDSNLQSTVPIDISTEDLVNYVPVVASSSISTQSTLITETVNFTINVSDTIQNETNYVSINWGDGTDLVSAPSTLSVILVNHTFYAPGSYTPTAVITNTPNADTGSLSSLIYNLPSVSVSSIRASGTANASEVNPQQAVGFDISVAKAAYPSSDGLILTFGDGPTYNSKELTSFNASHNYTATGTFDPVLEITSQGNVVEKVTLQPVSVVPVTTNFASSENNMLEHLSLNYSSLSPLKEVRLYLNGTLAESIHNPRSNGNLYYNFSINRYQKNLAAWNITTVYGYSQNDSAYYMQEFEPAITSLTSSANPAIVGSNVFFSYDINWGNDTGKPTIMINGLNITGSSYGFESTGSYNVTLIANNSQGQASYSITEYIENMPSVNYVNSNLSSTYIGKTVEFSTNVSWNGENGNITWLVNGESVLTDEAYLNYTFSSPGDYNISVLASNVFGNSTKTVEESVQSGIPAILKAYSALDPIYAGNTTSFVADVTWSGDNGTIIWAINGQNITGNSFKFLSSGNFTVKATAINEYGNSSKSFTLEVFTSYFTKQKPGLDINLIYEVIGGVASAGFVAAVAGYLLGLKKKTK